MYNLCSDAVGFLRDSQRKQGAAASGAYHQQILFRNGRLCNLSHIMGFDSQVGKSLTDGLKR